MTKYSAGDWVIYRKSKMGTHPGPRALHVNPSSKGERYSYVVEKFWIVNTVLPEGRLELITRRGKRHVISAQDPNLRHAGWICRWMYRDRFIAITQSNAHDSDDSGSAHDNSDARRGDSLDGRSGQSASGQSRANNHDSSEVIVQR